MKVLDVTDLIEPLLELKQAKIQDRRNVKEGLNRTTFGIET